MSDSGSDKTKKILLGVGAGCLGLVLMCCLSGFGAVAYRRSSVGSAAQEHAETFLGQVQAGDWQGAFESTEWDVSFAYRDASDVQRCFGDTAVGDLTSFECTGTRVDGLDDDADVDCTVHSASRGEQEITIHINSATDQPYLGFTYFSSQAAFGGTWAGDGCTGYSGREGVMDPPDGRVRPPGRSY